MPLILLTLTLAALACGPLLYQYARSRVALLAFLDGFMLVSIAGLVLLEAVPGTFSAGGAWSALFILLGLLGPSALEHGLTRAREKAHLLALLLAILGLMIHSLGDGVVLSQGGDAHAMLALPLAVAVHSVPVGLAVWWLLYPVFGAAPPLAAIVGMAGGTIAGFLFGPELGAHLGSSGWAWFQALVAGSILHVVFGRPHIDPGEHRHYPPRYEGLGNLCALLGLVALALLESEPLPAAAGFHLSLQLGLIAAPWILLLDLLLAVLLALRQRGAAPLWQRSLQLAGLELPDRGAPHLLALLLILGFGLPLLWPAALQLSEQSPGAWQITAALLITALLAGSMLRRGSRAWLADLTPRLGQSHGHHHHH